MGTSISKLFDRLKKEFVKVNILQAGLDSIVFFLATNLALFFFSISLIGGIPNLASVGVITIILFSINLYYRSQNYNLTIYERKNPELREILRTGKDYEGHKDIVSKSLFRDLLERAKKVTSDSIIPTRQIIKKIVIAGALSFLVVFSGLSNYQIESTEFSIVPEGTIPNIVGEGEEEEGFKLRNASEIYSERADIDTEDMQVDINIEGSGKETDQDTDPGRREPEEVVLDFTGSSLSEDYQLAKKYSLAIKEKNN